MQGIQKSVLKARSGRSQQCAAAAWRQCDVVMQLRSTRASAHACAHDRAPCVRIASRPLAVGHGSKAHVIMHVANA